MYEYNCRILKVVDSDTIDVDIDLGFNISLFNQRIKLKGINTPESRTRNLEEKKFGFLTKEMVQSYCSVGKTLSLRTSKDEREQFGCLLGEFMVYHIKNDAYQTLNSILVEEGYAVEDHGQSEEEIKEKQFFNRERLRGLLNE